MKKYMTDVYDSIALKMANKFTATSEISNKIISEFFKALPDGSSIVDVGPGKGAEAKLALELGHSVTAIEVSPHMASLFKKNVPNANCVLASMTEFPAGIGQFDALIAINSLLHLDRENGIIALSEFHKAIKSNGTMLLATSLGQGNSEENKRDWLEKIGVEKWYFYHWQKTDLQNAIERADFQIEQWNEEIIVSGRPIVAFITARKKM